MGHPARSKQAAILEDVLDGAACAFGYLAGALGGAYASVLGSLANAFADGFAAFDGVEGGYVGDTFAGTFGDVACGSAGAFADVAGTAADVSTGATACGRRCRRLGLGGRRRRGLILGEGGCAGKKECENESAGYGLHGA